MTALSAPTTRTIVTGASLLASATVIASVGNYAVNVFTARVMTPAEFSDANLMVTIMLTVTSIALGLQLVAAHYISHDASPDEHVSARTVAALRRVAWAIGAILGILLALGSGLWSNLLNTDSATPFIVLGAALPFYLAQSVSRGVLQGRLKFVPLALSYVIEMIARVGAVVLFVTLGWGVVGATAGLAFSFLATWGAVALVARPKAAGHDSQGGIAPNLRVYSSFVAVLLVGQMIANNSDVFAAKLFLEPDLAGLYSSVALIGRAVFFVAWSIATVVFPAVARRRDHGGSQTLLRGGILATAAMGAITVVAALAFGGSAMEIVFGSSYTGLAIPLASYAAVTTLWAIANLVATSRLSLGHNDASWLVLGGAVIQVFMLAMWHDSILWLIAAQAVAVGLTSGAMIARMMVLQTNRGGGAAHEMGRNHESIN